MGSDPRPLSYVKEQWQPQRAGQVPGTGWRPRGWEASRFAAFLAERARWRAEHGPLPCLPSLERHYLAGLRGHDDLVTAERSAELHDRRTAPAARTTDERNT